MEQRRGHQERSKEPELPVTETMKAEVQNNEEEDDHPKAKEQKLKSVFGVADLKNRNNVLSILLSPIFCF